MKEFLVYFAGFGCMGLILGFVIVKIIPKNQKSREELADFILRATTAVSIAAGM